jgi:hypothetical protein
MKQVIEGLCRATNSASTTSGGSATSNSSLADQALGVQRLQRIAAAFVLQAICHESEESSKKLPASPLDVQLVQFALSQFSECLEKTELSLGTGAEPQAKIHDEDAVKSRYELTEAIPIPSLDPVTTVARRGSSRTAKASTSDVD